MRKSMLALTLAAILIPAAGAFAEAPLVEPQNPLKGVTSVFINSADMNTKLEIRRVLQRHLPKLKYPKKPSEADVIIEIRTNLNPTRLDNRKQPEIVYRSGGQISSGTDGIPTKARPVEQSGPRMIVNGMSGVAVRGDVILVVHHGVSSPFFPVQFANELVKAYREANPEPAKP